MTIKKLKKNGKDASQFRIWEKDRRYRFNLLLDQLALQLPGQGNTEGTKWTKAKIVEQAITFIKSKTQETGDTQDVSETTSLGQGCERDYKTRRETLFQRRCRQLERQLQRLKEIIRSQLASEISAKDFSKMSCQQISEYLVQKEKSKRDKNGSPGSEPEIFVADINPPNDHSYSLIVQSEPEIEVVTITDEAENIDPDDDDGGNCLQEVQVVTVSQPLNTFIQEPRVTTTFSPTNTIQAVLAPQQTVLFSVLEPVKGPPKLLPWPKVVSQGGLVQTVSVYKQPLVTASSSNSQVPVWKLPKKPRKKRRPKLKPVLPKAVTPPPPVAKEVVAVEEGNQISSTPKVLEENFKVRDPDFDAVQASSSLPQAILASEDPTSEEECTQTNAKANDKSSNTSSERKEVKSCKTETKSSKKSKNSYSIAALCQISVNIGGDPSLSADSLTVGVNSPGMVSLNSVGTVSPVATPVPTPTPPTVVSTTPLPVIPINKGIESITHIKEKEPSKVYLGQNPKSETPKVIEELQPAAKSHSELKNQLSAAVVGSSKDESHLPLIQPSSPTKSFLTQFPVVKEKTSNTPTKETHKSHEKNLQVFSPQKMPNEKTSLERTPNERISNDRTSNDKASNASSSKQELAVFDFPESRHENYVYDITKQTQTQKENQIKFESTSASSRSSSSSVQSNRWVSSMPKTVTSSKPQSTLSNNPPPPKLINTTQQQQLQQPVSYSNKVPSMPITYTERMNELYAQQTIKAVTTSQSLHNSYPTSYNISSANPPTSLPSYQKSSNHHFHHHFPYTYTGLAPQPSTNFNMQSSSHSHQQHHQQQQQQLQHQHQHTDFMSQQPISAGTSSISHSTYHNMSVNNIPYSLQHYNLPTSNSSITTTADLNQRHFSSHNYCGTSSDSKQDKNTTRNVEPLPHMLPQPPYLPPPPTSQMPVSQPAMLMPQEGLISSNVMENDQSNLFSVTQLVSAKSHSQPQQSSSSSSSRKSSKRSNTSAVTSSRQAKQQRYSDMTTMKEPEREDPAKKNPVAKTTSRGSHVSSRGVSSKSSKRSYSAESLLSNNEGMVISMDPGTMEVDSKTSIHHSSYKPSDFGWTLGDQGTSSQLVFPPVSPSPASGTYFSNDLSDFASAIFGTSAEPVVPSPPVNQNRSQYSQQHKRSSVSHHNTFLSQNSSGDGTGDTASHQQCLNQSIFDNNLFLLPSSTDDAMGGCANNATSSNNFLQPSMSLYIQPQQQAQHQSSKHYTSHQNYSKLSHSSSQMNNSNSSMSRQQSQQGGGSHHTDHQQLILPPISSGGVGTNPGSSYINFNLSTIFPEINFVNEKLAVQALLPTHPPPPPPAPPAPTHPVVPPSSMSSKPSSTIPTSSTSTSGSGMDHMRQLTTPDLLPHSIAILGHSSHQVPLGGVHFSGSFSANMMQGSLNFQLPES